MSKRIQGYDGKAELFYDSSAIRPYVAIIPAMGKKSAKVIYAYTAESRKRQIRQYFHKPLTSEK